MGIINLDRWWSMMPKESKIVAFMLIRECSLKETKKCLAKKHEVEFHFDND